MNTKGEVRYSTDSRDNSGSGNEGTQNLKYVHQLKQIVEGRSGYRANSDSLSPNNDVKSPSSLSSGLGYLNQQQYESKNHIANVSNDRSEAFFQRVQKNNQMLASDTIKEISHENLTPYSAKNQLE